MQSATEWQRAKTLFNACLDLDSAGRAELLARACADAPRVRAEVESLLESAGEASRFLEQPAVEQAMVGATPEQMIGQRLGAYEIVAVLGAGGMGEVYRAVRADNQYQQEVAIKLVRRGLRGALTLARFTAERQILARLDHPNIARLLDAGLTSDEQPYFIMQLVEGESIDRYCDARQLSVKDRLRLFCDVCSAVQYAHQNLTVHRDLKPANILVTRDGVPKLLDFGIAKVLDAEANQPAEAASMWAMTPEYSSPEQVRGESITTASDVYSLGVILYRLLSGRSPYRASAAEPFELAKDVCDTEPPRPSTTVARGSGDAKPLPDRSQLVGDLDSIVLMALRKEPERRYASVALLAQDIRRHLDGLPVSAARDTWRYRTGKFIGRHRVVVVATAMATVLLFAGVAAIVAEERVARAERQRADRRFNEVRGLARALIFDLEEAIAPLAGSTAARKLLVDRALQYLDTLAGEARGDLSLQRELAAGYRKLGTIQGGSVQRNLGDTDGARQSLRKALVISESVALHNPDSLEDQLALAKILDRNATLELNSFSNAKAAFDYEKRASAIVEAQAVKHPSDLKVLDLSSSVHEMMGSIQAGSGSSASLGDVDGGIENHRKSLAEAERLAQLQPDSEPARMTVFVNKMNLADDFMRKGDRGKAIEIYRAIAKQLEAIGFDHLHPEMLHNAVTVYERIGIVQLMDGDPSSATGSFQSAVAIEMRSVAADPSDALARIDLYTDQALLGLAVSQAGQHAAGLATLDGAIANLEHERALDPASFAVRVLSLDYVLRGQLLLRAGNFEGSLADFRRATASVSAAVDLDPQAKLTLAAIDSKVADVHARQGDQDGAQRLYARALATLEPLVIAAQPAMEVVFATADTYSGLGEILMQNATQPRESASAKVIRLREARARFVQAADIWRKVPTPGRINMSGFITAGPSRPVALLARCDAELARLGVELNASSHPTP